MKSSTKEAVAKASLCSGVSRSGTVQLLSAYTGQNPYEAKLSIKRATASCDATQVARRGPGRPRKDQDDLKAKLATPLDEMARPTCRWSFRNNCFFKQLHGVPSKRLVQVGWHQPEHVLSAFLQVYA